MTFKSDIYHFMLTTPEYELPVFGYRVGELRLVTNALPGEVALLKDLPDYLARNEIKICTFRGIEDIHVIRILEDIGFRFVSTYCIAVCPKRYYEHKVINSEIKIRLGTEADAEQILDIAGLVSDYSTFAVDPEIPFEVVGARNKARTKAIMKKENYCGYVSVVGNIITGFIQYVVDIPSSTAYTQSAAIHPDYHQSGIGETLFRESMRTLFDSGCEIVVNDSYSTQNIGSYKVHAKCNFFITDHEIHMRLFCR